jgi:ATP-dependent Clp protease ATP-binding subunit ClpA
MFERFTSRARAMMVLAQVESRALNHAYIGTEHILLGLVHEGGGVAAQALEALGINLDLVREQVEEIIGRGKQARAPSGHIPFTPRAKKVLELSLREALQLGHNYIGTEHILLGLIREGEGVAAQVLVRLGADHDQVRAQVIHMLVARESAEPAEAGETRIRRLVQPPAAAAAHGPAAGDVSLPEALEAIGERLGAIEARLGMTGHQSPSRADLERELARLTALLRTHGIDPDAEAAADPGDEAGVGHGGETGGDPGDEVGHGGETGGDPGDEVGHGGETGGDPGDEADAGSGDELDPPGQA